MALPVVDIFQGTFHRKIDAEWLLSPWQKQQFLFQPDVIPHQMDRITSLAGNIKPGETRKADKNSTNISLFSSRIVPSGTLSFHRGATSQVPMKAAGSLFSFPWEVTISLQTTKDQPSLLLSYRRLHSHHALRKMIQIHGSPFGIPSVVYGNFNTPSAYSSYLPTNNWTGPRLFMPVYRLPKDTY